MSDLKSPTLLWAKGFLFLFLGLFAAVLLVVQAPSLTVAALLVLSIWVFCRAYYKCSRGSGDQIQAHGVSRGGRVREYPQPRQRRKKACITARLLLSWRCIGLGDSVAPAGAFFAYCSHYPRLAPWARFSSPRPGLEQW